jgi:hypothetical protein
MEITIKQYGTKVIYDSDNEDLTRSDVVEAFEALLLAIGYSHESAPVNPMWENFERYRRIVMQNVSEYILQKINDEYANN